MPCACNRPGLQRSLHDPQVEAGEMIELQPLRVRQERFEVRRGIVATLPETNEMLVALPVRKLDDAQPVAARIEPHRLGIDGDWSIGEADIARQVFLVQMNGHSNSFGQAQGVL